MAQAKINRLNLKSKDQFKAKKWLRSESFKVGFLKDDNNNPPQFAIIVSKRINKRAVIRNKIKRKINSSIYKLQVNIDSGLKYLIIVQKDISDFDATQIDEELSKILIKTK